MRIQRRFTSQGKSPYEGVAFRTTTSEIRNPDGSLVFRLEDIEVPADWSQVACDILAQKYFRKAGIAVRLRAVEEAQVPSWLWRRAPDEHALEELDADARYGAERLDSTPPSDTICRGYEIFRQKIYCVPQDFVVSSVFATT